MVKRRLSSLRSPTEIDEVEFSLTNYFRLMRVSILNGEREHRMRSGRVMIHLRRAHRSSQVSLPFELEAFGHRGNVLPRQISNLNTCRPRILTQLETRLIRRGFR